MEPSIFLNIELKDWAVVLSTLFGPIFAIQAQKVIERFIERRSRKVRLFEQLMATRAERLSAEHVRALNMIDLVFYGSKTAGIPRRSSKEQRILDAWKEYLDHLNNKADESQIVQWVTQGDELFINVLYAISQEIGYKFDRVQLKRGAYSPVAHSALEQEQSELRQAALAVFSGKRHLNMNVVGLPVDPDAVEANKRAIQNVGKALESGVLHVNVLDQSQA